MGFLCIFIFIFVIVTYDKNENNIGVIDLYAEGLFLIGPHIIFFQQM